MPQGPEQEDKEVVPLLPHPCKKKGHPHAALNKKQTWVRTLHFGRSFRRSGRKAVPPRTSPRSTMVTQEHLPNHVAHSRLILAPAVSDDAGKIP